MFQVCTMFVYYHELGHIIQFSGAEKRIVEEKRAKAFAKKFNILDHAEEFDSDEFAINLTFEQLKYHWEKTISENKSSEALEGFLTINVVALFILFDLLSGGVTLPLYYEKYDHPHDVIRIIAIIGIFMDKFDNYIDTKKSGNKILIRTFEILKNILVENQSVDKFLAAIRSDRTKIAEYSEKILHVRSQYAWMAGQQMSK